MGKKKNFWYVLVMTNDGPRFVTDVAYSPHKEAKWELDKKPLELSETSAKDISLGLLLNFYMALPVCSPIEMTEHPYRYACGHFEWIDDRNADRKEV